MRIPVDVTDQGFYFLGLVAGVPTAGLTTFAVEYSKNGATSWTDMTTPTITEIENGAYWLLCDEGMTLTAGNHSESMLFRITQASMDTVFKEVEIYRSDVLSQISDIESSLVVVKSDLVVITSDTTAVESELIVVHSETTVIASDAVVLTTNVASLSTKQDSDMVVVAAGHTKTQSDIVILDNAVSDVESSLVIVKSDLVVITSDTTAIEASTSPQVLQTTTIATLASQTSFTLTTGSADDDAYNNQMAIITDVSTGTQKAIGLISDYTGATKTVTLTVDPAVFVMAATDNISIIAITGSSIGVYVDANGYVQIEGALNQLDDLNDVTVQAVIDEFETQSQADPTGFHVNLMEVGGTAQTAGNITAMVSDVESSLVIIKSDLVVITSDTTAVESELIVTHSETTALQAQATTIASDLVVIDSAVSDVESSLVIVKSDLVVITSDSTAIHLDTTTIASDLVITASDIVLIQSLLDDARTEPAQGTPPVNPDLATKVDYLYKAWRNRSTQTATTYSLYADDATTVDHKATVSDNGTTADKGEVATGP